MKRLLCILFAASLGLQSIQAYGHQVIVQPPGTWFEGVRLETPVSTTGGEIQVTLMPRPQFAGLIPFYRGLTVTNVQGLLVEVRMEFRECGDEFLCPYIPTRTLAFQAPQVAGEYSVRVTYVLMERINTSVNPPEVPFLEEFAGTDVLTVLGPAEPISESAEPIPSLGALGRIALALVLLLAGLAVPFIRRP